MNINIKSALCFFLQVLKINKLDLKTTAIVIHDTCHLCNISPESSFYAQPWFFPVPQNTFYSAFPLFLMPLKCFRICKSLIDDDGKWWWKHLNLLKLSETLCSRSCDLMSGSHDQHPPSLLLTWSGVQASPGCYQGTFLSFLFLFLIPVETSSGLHPRGELIKDTWSLEWKQKDVLIYPPDGTETNALLYVDAAAKPLLLVWVWFSVTNHLPHVAHSRSLGEHRHVVFPASGINRSPADRLWQRWEIGGKRFHRTISLDKFR